MKGFLFVILVENSQAGELDMVHCICLLLVYPNGKATFLFRIFQCEIEHNVQ